MPKKLRKTLGKALVLLCMPLLAFALEAGPKNELPQDLKDVGIFPNMGANLSLDTPFQNEDGEQVQLGKYFDGRRPVVVIMAYYGCPMLCGLILNAARESLERFEWKIGEKYQVLTI